MTRRSFAAAVLLAGAGCARTARKALAADPAEAVRLALLRAAEYLWARQSTDGGWHSQTYGLLASGQSLTPFVLDALLSLPDGAGNSVETALAFCVDRMDEAGALGRAEPGLPDHPNYATALAVSSLAHAKPANWRTTAAPLLDYLQGQQLTEQNGWSHDHPAYGAWGMGGEPRQAPYPGHVDLSMTRHVLQALRAAGVPSIDPCFRKAQVFVERCQNYPAGESTGDGGFYFSTVVLDANKAGSSQDGYRSYGTATADGILSLLACGQAPEDPRVISARQWIDEHHCTDGAAGFEGDIQQRWREGLRYYFAASASEAFRRLKEVSDPQLATKLVSLQREDGSWANPEKLVKEDDPLIATAFAVRALTATGFA
jgi:hypothetical protein